MRGSQPLERHRLVPRQARRLFLPGFPIVRKRARRKRVEAKVRRNRARRPLRKVRLIPPKLGRLRRHIEGRCLRARLLPRWPQILAQDSGPSRCLADCSRGRAFTGFLSLSTGRLKGQLNDIQVEGARPRRYRAARYEGESTIRFNAKDREAAVRRPCVGGDQVGS